MEMDKVQILATAYNAHKQELMYRRRSEYITGVTAVLFYTLSMILVLYHPVLRRILESGANKILASVVVVIIANMQCYHLIKNYKRHCDIQRAICSMDHAFGFFIPGEYLADEALYDESWKKTGHERAEGIFSRSLIIIAFASLLVITIWMKGWS
jgi:hypothetical protein